jgi:hypothetical protein
MILKKNANQQLKENVKNKAYSFALLCVSLGVLCVMKDNIAKACQWLRKVARSSLSFSY